PVPRERKLSERIRKIAVGQSKLAKAANRIQEIVNQSTYLNNKLTAYNWADISKSQNSKLGALGKRKYALNAQDVQYYLDLSSEQHRVKMIFRGHQHRFQHLVHEG